VDSPDTTLMNSARQDGKLLILHVVRLDKNGENIGNIDLIEHGSFYFSGE